MSIFRHRHRYEAAAVDRRPGGSFGTPPVRTTFVLWRCPCGDACSTEIPGSWSLGQVRGERETAPESVERTASGIEEKAASV